MKEKHWEGPREKIRLKGVESLTTVELLQVIIGSGNSYASVAKIARRTLSLLRKNGTAINYEQLASVPGLGPARVCQILALFEIASRYNVPTGQLLLDSTEKGLVALSEIKEALQETVMIILLDGGYRLIDKRLYLVGERHPTEMLRQMFVSVLKDRADKIIVGIGSRDRKLEPSMFDLVFARDVKSMSRLCQITVRDFLIVNKSGENKLNVTR